MKLRTVSALCLAAGSMFAATSAMAWTSADKEWTTSASIAGTTDYMWRGYSNSDNKPAIQGSFDVSHSSGLYAGVWSSNVNFPDGNGRTATQEIDAYGGLNKTLDNGIGYDVGALRYIYPGTSGIDWNEYHLNLSYSYFTVGAAYSNDVYGTGDSATYYSGSFDYGLPMDVSLSAGLGYYKYTGGTPDPLDFHIGVSKDFAGFGMDLTYYTSNKKAADVYGDSNTSNRLVFTISKSM